MTISRTTWYGKDAAVKIGSAISGSPGTSGTALWTQLSGTDYSGECKELTINPGGHDVAVLNVYGNQLVEESRPGLVTADFTMVLVDHDIFALSFATASSAPSGMARYQGTDSTGSRTKRAVAFKLASSAGGTLNILMNNAYITAQGEVSLAADGSAEQSFSAACLISDYYVESG